MVITLCGDDSARITARVQALVEEHVPGDLSSLNLLELDGTPVSVEELRAACDSMPFLGDRRVVLVKGLLRRFSDKASEETPAKPADAALVSDLKKYLPALPDTTILIFVERRRLGSSAAANALKALTKVEEYSLPEAGQLPSYIAMQVRDAGGSIDRNAAALLAQAVADNPLRLEQELSKLLAYKTPEKQIAERDVRDLVDIPLEVAVWDLTDALFARDSARSLRSLRSLLERGQVPQQVMGAVASQLRNLVVADDYRGQGADALASSTGMKPFVARKTSAALRNFQPGEPRRLLSALVDLDLRSKTGKAELSSAFEFFVVEACARRL